MISTTWIEERYTEPGGLVVHKTIALHGSSVDNSSIDFRIAYIKHDVFSILFVQRARNINDIFRDCMLIRMYKIIMEISGSPTGE